MNAAKQAAARSSETYSDTGDFVGAFESVELFADFTNSQRMQQMDASVRPSASYPEDSAPGGWPFQQARFSTVVVITNTFVMLSTRQHAGYARLEVSSHGIHVLDGFIYAHPRRLAVTHCSEI